jgi:hypothetical protein
MSNLDFMNAKRSASRTSFIKDECVMLKARRGFYQRKAQRAEGSPAQQNFPFTMTDLIEARHV